MYPLALVKRKLLEERLAGEWSDLLYTIYTANPLAGIIDAFQRTVLAGTAPDFAALIPGFVLIVTCLPLSYMLFKKAEGYFADTV
jgi:lipopolysaccharide transport system permease protein